MGYFACAQYDALFIPYRHFVPLPPKEEAKPHVILNAVKNPTEELTGIYFFTLVVGYFAYAQYDVLFIPYRHFVPLPPKEEAIIVFAREAKRRSNPPGGRFFAKYILLALVVGYFACAQYDVLLLPPSGEASATPTIGDKSAR